MRRIFAAGLTVLWLAGCGGTQRPPGSSKAAAVAREYAAAARAKNWTKVEELADKTVIARYRSSKQFDFETAVTTDAERIEQILATPITTIADERGVAYLVWCGTSASAARDSLCALVVGSPTLLNAMSSRWRALRQMDAPVSSETWRVAPLYDYAEDLGEIPVRDIERAKRGRTETLLREMDPSILRQALFDESTSAIDDLKAKVAAVQADPALADKPVPEYLQALRKAFEKVSYDIGSMDNQLVQVQYEAKGFPITPSDHQLTSVKELSFIPKADPWGTPYAYYSDGKHWAMISAGADKTFEPFTPAIYTAEPRTTTAEGADIIITSRAGRESACTQCPARNQR